MRPPVDPLWLSKERDLFYRLLQLSERSNVEPFLQDALAIVVAMTHAGAGYIELFDDRRHDPPRWWQAHECSERDLRDIRALISRGIVSEALATGETVYTERALEDPRFSERESVRRNGLQAILCAPVGYPPVGVVYLQAENGGRFAIEDSRRLAELFARHLAPLARRLLARAQDRDPTRSYRQRLKDCSVFVGQSEELAEVLRMLNVLRTGHEPVLLTGAAGTGKTIAGRVLAANTGGPLVVIDCRQAPEGDGMESIGEGTLLVRHVGALSSPAQARLEELLERTGGPRVVATSVLDLEQREGFRRELLERFTRVALPTLASRREDIEQLIEHFCRVSCKRHGIETFRLSPWALRSAESAEWLGNVRQLEEAVDAAVVLARAEGASIIGEKHLFPTRFSPEEPRSLEEATREFKRRLVLEALERTDWNVREAARQLEIARSHLYELIAMFGLRRAGGRSVWN
jgi:transcriptional regulator with GAF, ATPase, and Fis domain